MRPYIICHMVASIDGRIDCAMVDQICGDEYYTTLAELDCPSALEGRVTREHYGADPTPLAIKDHTPVGEPSVHVARESEGYAIVADTKGKLNWETGMLDHKPLLCILSEQAPREYLEMLRKKNISWIAVGKEAIDLPKAMDILGDSFGVERLVLLGGGHINGGFLHAGLIDEVSLLLAPGIDGREGQTALFDGIMDKERQPVALALRSVERMDNDVLWLRYLMKLPEEE